MNRDFIKGAIAGVIGIWAVAAHSVAKNEIEENKKLKEIIKNKEKEA